MLYRKWFTVLSLFVIAALLLGACQPVQPVGSDQPERDAPATVIADFHAAHNAGDIDGLMALVADGAVFRSAPGTGATLDTPESIRAFWQSQIDAKTIGEIVSSETSGDTVRFEVKLSHDDVPFATDYVAANVQDGKITAWDFDPGTVDLPRRGLAQVNDITMYYELHGEGEPLLLLHGGTASGAETWAYHIPRLAESYQVIVPDARAHGRTTDSEQPLSYARMADDYIELLDKLGIEQANVVGWSDGAIVGLYMLQQHPERVRAFAGMEPNFTVEGTNPGFLEWATNVSPETYPAFWADLYYRNIAPDPEHFPEFLKKMGVMWSTQPTFTKEDFAANQVPILLLSGELSDVVQPAHLAEWAAAIPETTLKSVPGYGHGFPTENPDEFLDIVGAFLREQGSGLQLSTLDDATVAKIEALVEGTMASGQVPGVAVGIVKDGELVYAKGFGVTDLGSEEPVTPETVFVMMSIAKSGVGMAIMQLVEDGKIDLDAPVTEYLPYFALAERDIEGITIRRLLSHTAGVPSSIDSLAAYRDENKRTDGDALDDYVRSLSDEPLAFQPGAQWDYSDAGFDLLADVVAKVSGQSFEDYMQEHILTPLGMEDSSYLLSDVNPAMLATPYIYDEDGQAVEPDFFPYTRIHAPSGGLLSNLNDMARFAIANMNHGEFDGTRVLQASTYDEMWAPQADSTWTDGFGPQVTSYALGWWVGEFNGHTIIGNYGADAGFQSHLGMFPDEDYAVIAMVNLHDPEAGSFLAYDIGNGVAEVLLDGE